MDIKEYQRQWYQKNKERLDIYHREWRRKNNKEVREYFRKYRELHKDKLQKRAKKVNAIYYQNNKERIKKVHRKYKAWYVPAHKKEAAEYRKKYHQEHPEQDRTRHTNWLAKNKDKNIMKQRERVYKISHKEYLEIYNKQNGCCAICGKPSSSLKRGLSVDHDHKCCIGYKSCGKCIRGLLCITCNNGLGMFRDEVRLLKKAMEYLEKRRVNDK
jgi:hypothetical protein